MENDKPPRPPLPLPAARVHYDLLKAAEACGAYNIATNKKSDRMDAADAAGRAIKLMTDADPTLQRLMREAMREGPAMEVAHLQAAADTPKVHAYSEGVRAAFKARCVKPPDSL
jgi:hypothetical protein